MQRQLGLDIDEDFVKTQRIDPVAAELTMSEYLQYFLTNWNRMVRGTPRAGKGWEKGQRGQEPS
jgi:hypothetical protein